MQDSFLSLRMNKCLERVDRQHFSTPGVFSYAMIPRCRPNSRVFFFIVTSIIYGVSKGLNIRRSGGNSSFLLAFSEWFLTFSKHATCCKLDVPMRVNTNIWAGAKLRMTVLEYAVVDSAGKRNFCASFHHLSYTLDRFRLAWLLELDGLHFVRNRRRLVLLRLRHSHVLSPPVSLLRGDCRIPFRFHRGCVGSAAVGSELPPKGNWRC